MLLQIEVFPATEVLVPNAGSSTGTQPPPPPPSIQSIVPAMTHYINTSIPITNQSNTSSSSTNILWSMGRKQGDYLITTDRSVSREHIRLLKIETEEKNESSRNILQIETLGKLGSSLVIEETFMESPNDDADDKDGNVNQNDDSDTTVDESYLSHHRMMNKSNTTNTINIHSNNIHSNSHHRSQNQRASQQSIQDDVELSSITKHLTQQALTSIATSYTTTNKPHWNYNIRLQSIGANQTLTVAFDDNHDHDNCNNATSTTTLQCDYHHPNRMILQCGKVGTTIVITRIQLRFVASRVPMKQFLLQRQSEIEIVLGGTIQDSLLCHRNEYNNDSSISSSSSSSSDIGGNCNDCATGRTTYLISAEYHGTPKHIIAWCRNIPVVQPSFVTALMDEFRNKIFQSSHLYTQDVSPFPNQDFIQRHVSPILTKDRKHFERTANPQLWKDCTLISPLNDMDHYMSDHDHTNDNTIHVHSRNEQELDEMVQAAGAKVVTIHSLLKDDDNLLRQKEAFDDHTTSMNTIRHLLDAVFVDQPTTTFYFMLDTPLMKSQYPMAMKIFQELYGIPTLTAKEVALAITEQRNIQDQKFKLHEDQQQKQQKIALASVNLEGQQIMTTVDKTPTTKRKVAEASTEIDIVPDTRSRKQSVAPASTRSKRTRGGTATTAQPEVWLEESTVATSETAPTPIQKNSSTAAEPRGATSARRRRRAIAPNDNLPDDSILLHCHDTPPGDVVAQNVDSPLANVVDSEITNEKTTISIGGQTDGCDNGVHMTKQFVTTCTKGWLTTLHQDPTRKRVHIKRNAMLNKSEDVDDDDVEKITCSEPATTQTMKGMIVEPMHAPLHSQVHRIQPVGPNYKTFRKNTVPASTIMTVVSLQPYRASKSRIVVSSDDDAQRRQAEAQQRRADELFR